ncbi:MAG: serine/threonine-protein kinase, partial [Kofleriaceae bacterium]
AHDPELGRQVAIKILASEHEVARTRLLREAQAMARLSHSNVVTVHEVLKVGDRTAIVMELVDGRDLAGWLAEAERGWREIVDAFVQAARGLAAAHKAGMVHRDFKPSNALIDRDGVVRVTDFGLVHTGVADPVDAHRVANDRPDARLTQTGALLGTPAYMAPEQHEGGPVDARTDQWAFACALYGALYRQRAFVGETCAELAIAVKLEKPRPEPATTKVPRAIRASIRRALSHDPTERFGSMDDLIVALTPPLRAWVAAGVIGGLAAAAAVGAVLLTGGDNVVTCDGLDAPFAATWNADRAHALSSQFATTGIGYAADAAKHFGAAIDRYRIDWTAMRTRACTDARRGAISADLLDRRMHCLDVRLAEVATVVDTAVAADATTINAVIAALARVTGVATCTDPIDTVPRPTDAAARAAIARAETDVARAATLSNLGRFDQARALAESAIKVSDQTGWTPLAAKALYEVGQAQSRVRDPDAALVTFDRAADAAARSADDTLFAKVLVQRFYVLTTDLKRVDEAFAGRHYIELAVLRSHAPVVRAMWLSMLASGLEDQGKHQEALDTQIESTALWKQVVEPDSIALSDCLNNEAGYRMQLGQLDEAQAIFENLLVTDAAKFGPGNPELARRHYNLANIALKRGDNDKAIEHFEKTYAIRKAAGVVDWMSAYALGENLGNLGRPAAAAPLFLEALEILERTQKSSEYVVAGRYALGNVLVELGQLDQARAWLDKALTTARATKSSGADEVLASFALLAVASGDLPAARRYIAESRAESKAHAASESSSADLAESEIAMLEHDCARATQVFDRLTKGGEAEVAISILTEITIGRADCTLSTGTAAAKQAARDALEKRLAWLDTRKPELGATAPLRFMLARVLVATGGERDRVRTLAETARDGFATLGNPGKKRAAQVTSWLAAL